MLAQNPSSLKEEVRKIFNSYYPALLAAAKMKNKLSVERVNLERPATSPQARPNIEDVYTEIANYFMDPLLQYINVAEVYDFGGLSRDEEVDVSFLFEFVYNDGEITDEVLRRNVFEFSFLMMFRYFQDNGKFIVNKNLLFIFYQIFFLNAIFQLVRASITTVKRVKVQAPTNLEAYWFLYSNYPGYLKKFLAPNFNTLFAESQGVYPVMSLFQHLVENMFKAHNFGIHHYKNIIILSDMKLRDINKLTHSLIQIEKDVNKIVKTKHIHATPGDTIIDFKNGWKWVMIPAAQCKNEGALMHHCGNIGGNEKSRIFSLREVVKVKRKTIEKPRLTFIGGPDVFGETKDGFILTEMKGFANTRPDKKFKKMIIKLLKHKIIIGVKGGGYLSENNFNWNTDLTEREQEQIMNHHYKRDETWFLVTQQRRG